MYNFRILNIGVRNGFVKDVGFPVGPKQCLLGSTQGTLNGNLGYVP